MGLEMDEGTPVAHVSLNAMIAGIKQNGVVSGLACSEDAGGASRYVDVAAGTCLVDDTIYTEASAKTDLQLDAAHATLDRIDLVYYDTATSEPAYVTGTAASTPTPPDIPAGDIGLAYVKRYANDDTIVDADIVDIRIFVKVLRLRLLADSSKTFLRDSEDSQVDVDPPSSYTDTGIGTITIPAHYDGGAVYVIYDVKRTVADLGASYSKIYKNDAAAGTEHLNNSNSWATYEESISVSGGDELEIWHYYPSGTDQMSYRNFRVYAIDVNDDAW